MSVKFLQGVKKCTGSVATLMFESVLFTIASQMVEGYAGGSWTSKKVGNVYIPVIPLDGPVKIENHNNGAMAITDAATAGAALALIALSHTAFRLHDRGLVSSAEALSTYFYEFQDAVRADKTLDSAAIFSITD